MIMTTSISREIVSPIIVKAIKQTQFKEGYNSIEFVVDDISISLAYEVKVKDRFTPEGEKNGDDTFEKEIIAINSLWLIAKSDNLVIDLDSATQLMVLGVFNSHTRIYINTRYNY